MNLYAIEIPASTVSNIPEVKDFKLKHYMCAESKPEAEQLFRNLGIVRINPYSLFPFPVTECKSEALEESLTLIDFDNTTRVIKAKDFLKPFE